MSDSSPTIRSILAEPLAIDDGTAVVSQAAGSGIEWNRAAVDRYSA